MKRILKAILAGALVLVMLPALVPCAPRAAASYTAPTDLVRIGIYTKESSGTKKTYPSANLQNVSGYGYGYEFGYYDGRTFVSLGATETVTDRVTVIKDKNVGYDIGSRTYDEGVESSIVVGCYHIRLETNYPDYASARAVADTFTSVNAFVRYENGGFYVLAGEFQSGQDARTVAEGLAISQNYTIDWGTANTVAVVQTGTNKILLEFDCGTKYNLAIRPLSTNGEKTLVYFKNDQYYGDFVYLRNTGGELTVVNYVNIEDYVKGVIPNEMTPSWPLEALKAGAVSARTYVMANLSKHKNLGMDICNQADCQVYHGRRKASDKTDQAVDETMGQYLTYQGALCNTFYYSSNGGASENIENVWNEAFPYLRGITDPYEAAEAHNISNYYWTVVYTGDELAKKLRSNGGYNCTTIVKFEITQFSDTGNVVKATLTDANGTKITLSKGECRTVLNLRSQRYTLGEGNAPPEPVTNYYVNSSEEAVSGTLSETYAIGSGGLTKLPEGAVYAITGKGTVEPVSGETEVPSGGASTAKKNFVINGAGWGHNVGLSQWGAYSMAKNYGLNYIDILTFYYTGTEIITSIPEPPPITDPVEPTEPTNPTDPTTPTDPTDPTTPTDPVDPTVPDGGEGQEASTEPAPTEQDVTVPTA